MPKLDGQVATVTGASRGVAIQLARHGAAVVIAARTAVRSHAPKIDGDGLEIGGSLCELDQTIKSEGGVSLPITCDLSDANQIEAMVKRARNAFERIDLLVNNGMPQETMTGHFWEQPQSVYDNQMTVGPRSYFLAARACAPVMIGQGSGVIVNVSSPGSCVDFYSAAYRVARAASDCMVQPSLPIWKARECA